jgi:glucose/galactose transporter
MAIGALVFIPAAQDRNYNLFLVGLFTIGTGLALLQTASNPYASIIGPIESAASRISIMGICNKFAGILATLIFGYIALNDADGMVANLKTMDAVTREATLQELASRVIIPYIIIASVLALLAVAVLFSSLPDIDDGQGESNAVAPTTKTSVFQFPHLILGVITLFVYVGVEVLAGDTIINYGKSLGIPMSDARYFTMGTLIFMIIGYVVGVFTIPKYVSQAKALLICAILGVILSVLAIITNGIVSVGFIWTLGLANSLMWPAIFPLAIKGLGKFTKIGSALLIMAIAGGAILPLIYGRLSDSWNTQDAYWIMVPCYLFILYYAAAGHKVGQPKAI